MKILDKRIETIDKQIGEMCLLKKSVDNNTMINQKPYYESVNNYYAATFNKPNQASNHENHENFYQQENYEAEMDQNSPNENEEIDNIYQEMDNLEAEDKDEKDIYEIIN